MLFVEIEWSCWVWLSLGDDSWPRKFECSGLRMQTSSLKCDKAGDMKAYEDETDRIVDLFADSVFRRLNIKFVGDNDKVEKKLKK